MRRRETLREQAATAPPAPIAVSWETPDAPKTAPGHCPKCGRHVGRPIRPHAMNCKGAAPA